jgi:hypothetical protein
MDGIERARFDHIGIVTDELHEGEVFVDTTRVWVTNPRDPRSTSNTCATSPTRP